jgi:L-lactate dehydrogenase
MVSASALVIFARALLEKSGLEADKAQTVAEILVEGDLLGHQTHGLQLLPFYLADLEKGSMTKVGEPRVVANFPAAVTWDGLHLPGPWLTVRAIDLAMSRAKINGTCTVIIRHSHHIACLAAYLKRVADLGYFIILTCSNPTLQTVAPHGGRRAIMTPNPLAAAWPTQGDPVILDVSMSITTNGLSNRLRKEGKTFPGPWAVDNTGQISNDPAVLYAEPPGALLPIGGSPADLAATAAPTQVGGRPPPAFACRFSHRNCLAAGMIFFGKPNHWHRPPVNARLARVSNVSAFPVNPDSAAVIPSSLAA